MSDATELLMFFRFAHMSDATDLLMFFRVCTHVGCYGTADVLLGLHTCRMLRIC